MKNIQQARAMLDWFSSVKFSKVRARSLHSSRVFDPSSEFATFPDPIIAMILLHLRKLPLNQKYQKDFKYLI